MTLPRPDIRSGDLLWTPDPALAPRTNLSLYEQWLRDKKGLSFPDYPSLWEWSVNDLEGFWGSVAEFFRIGFHQKPARVLDSAAIEETGWFPGGTLNYAQHSLFADQDQNADGTPTPCLLFEDEAGRREEITRADLRRRVATVAAALRSGGVRRGDRVAGYFPNTPEALVAFLAAASLGAIWSNAPAELSSRGVLERFAQIEPVVFIAVDAYRYGGKEFDRREIISEVLAGLPTVRQLILVEQTSSSQQPPPVRTGVEVTLWHDLFAQGEPPELVFEPVPFDHPLWILYSSGTTGAPKAIVQGHGGILLEHLKSLSFHLDLQSGDRFFWYTTSGWMMWNLLISGLLLPSVTVVLYDGSPKHPDLGVLWEFVDRNEITYFGSSAPFLVANMKRGALLAERPRFTKLRALGSTGAPLPVEAFGWVHACVKEGIQLGSISGGTDVCTAFVMSHPALPVRAGEMQCLALGAKLESWDEEGCHSFGRVGELVITAPMPSMPVFFWNDADRNRLRASYFERFPGAWFHGDWIEIGSAAQRIVIHGRSDSTLNRGGVRMGTAEFYGLVENLPEVAEALVIDTGGLGREDRLLLFVALKPGCQLDAALRQAICQRLKEEVSPRHVPDEIHAVPEIPHTLNGKKLEVPVKRILTGTPAARAVSREAMGNPEVLRWFIDFAESRGTASAP